MGLRRFRIGNDLTVLWAINNRDGSPFDLEGRDVCLYMTHDKGREEVKAIISKLQDGTINNVIRWDFAGAEQRFLGEYKLTAEISESATKRVITKDHCEAFTLVSRSDMEDEDGDANIGDQYELILSSKLDVYHFEAGGIDLTGIKESLAEVREDVGGVRDDLLGVRDDLSGVNETIKEVAAESTEIKVTINGIQQQVNDIGTEMTTKADVQTVVEIGEHITEVQNNVAEQTIKVNSLTAEIATKASAESVTKIADDLEIANKSIAEQTLKVSDIEAEVGTKASVESVTAISDKLEIATETLAEQKLKVDTMSAEIETKASVSSVTELENSLRATNETVAQQSIKVEDLSAEIETKASVSSVTELENSLRATNETVAQQSIKVEDLSAEIETKASVSSVTELENSTKIISDDVAEQKILVGELGASIATKVSHDEFNTATGEINKKYSEVVQEVDGITTTIGQQGGEITQIKEDITGITVSITGIEEAQKISEALLTSLTDNLVPEEMVTEIGKGVVLSTMLATKDANGLITAAMNASGYHADSSHGRIVFAGGVKDKEDWNEAPFVVYEDGYVHFRAGEIDDSVSLGGAYLKAVTTGSVDVLSYNGIPLFQINKNSSGKVISISSVYDMEVNGNFHATGNVAAGGIGGEGDPGSGGGVSLLNSWTNIPSDLSGYALGATLGVDLNRRVTALEGKATAVSFAQTLTSGKAIGTITIDGTSKVLYAPSKLSQFEDDVVAGKYLPISGANLVSAFKLRNSADTQGYDAISLNASYNTFGSPVMPLRLRSSSDIEFNKAGSSFTILHSGNYSSYALPLTGGTITSSSHEALVINRTGGNPPYLSFNSDGVTLGRIGFDVTSKDLIANTKGATRIIIHSGNVGEYALKKSTNIIFESDINVAGYGVTSKGWKYNGAAFILGYDQSYKMALQSDYTDKKQIIVVNQHTPNDGWLGWKTIAFTDSDITGNAASASKTMINYSYKQNVEYPLVFASRDNIGVAQNGMIYIDYYGKPTYNTSTETLTVPNLKLQNPRTIWGKSFDGTGNVSGDLTLGYATLRGASSESAIEVSANSMNIGYSYRTTGKVITVFGDTIRMAKDGAYTMFINSSGNVTIGGSDLAGTSAKLYVDGSVYVGNKKVLDRVSNNLHIGEGIRGSYDTSVFGTNILFNTSSGDNAMMIAIGGNVGIGTTGPQAKLHVNGVTRIQRYSDANSYLDITVGDVSINYNGYDADGWCSHYFQSNGTTRLMINGNNGNIGIGTTSPAYKLDVIGSVRALFGLKVTNIAIECDANGYQEGYTSEINRCGGNLYIQTREGNLHLSRVGGFTYIRGTAEVAQTLGVTGAATLSSTLSVTGATTLKSTLGVTGATTLSSTLSVSGLLTASSGIKIASGQSITFLDSSGNSHTLSYDSTNKAFKVSGSLYATGNLAAGAVAESGGTNAGGGGSIVTWDGLYDGGLTIGRLEIDGTGYEINIPTYPTLSTISGTLPVSKGGTGATTVAAARTSLGLGAAATYGVTTSVTSGSSALVTSGAVYTAIQNISSSGGGSTGRVIPLTDINGLAITVPNGSVITSSANASLSFRGVAPEDPTVACILYIVKTRAHSLTIPLVATSGISFVVPANGAAATAAQTLINLYGLMLVWQPSLNEWTGYRLGY